MTLFLIYLITVIFSFLILLYTIWYCQNDITYKEIFESFLLSVMPLFNVMLSLGCIFTLISEIKGMGKVVIRGRNPYV